MNFVNNWLREITLAAGALECPLDLPDGIYRLVLADGIGAAATRIEVISADVYEGIAELQRGLEGTADQTWGDGSIIHCTLTAGVLADLLAQLATQAAQIADLQARVTALEPSVSNLLLEVLFTEESWSFGDYPRIRSVQALIGGLVDATLELSLFSQASGAGGAGVSYNADYLGAPAVLIGYDNRLTVIDTGAALDESWEVLRVGLEGIATYDGTAAALANVDPRNELGSEAFLRDDGVLYVDIPLI